MYPLCPGVGPSEGSCLILTSLPPTVPLGQLIGSLRGLGPTSISCLPALSLFCGTMSEFPITTITNYHKLIGSKQVKVAQSCPTLCDPMDYTAHGILQARILEWAAFPFSRGSSQTRDRTHISSIAGRFFTS